ncbi:hypothetical protein FRC10_004373 [Ceratobasidium sp. 414]|nr:hypothetical protein FRC10_004373 [Ceratobasidium sp. 414]
MVRKQQVAMVPDELRQLPTIEQAGPPRQSEHPEEPKRPSEPDTRSVASSVYQSNDAAKLLWYPFVYTLCVLPWSVIRWTGFVHSDILDSPNILAPYMVFFGIFNLMGFFNVLLILLTRPMVLLLGSNEDSGVGDSRAASVENISLRARVSSHAAAGQDDGGNQQEHVETDETHAGQRSANHFGGADVALAREF